MSDAELLELDIAVAKATGHAVHSRVGEGIWLYCNGDEYRYRPSQDWGRAMEAAEAFGLFNWCLLSRDSETNEWFLLNVLTDIIIVRDESGPVAICKAIIQLDGAAHA